MHSFEGELIEEEKQVIYLLQHDESLDPREIQEMAGYGVDFKLAEEVKQEEEPDSFDIEIWKREPRDWEWSMLETMSENPESPLTDISEKIGKSTDEVTDRWNQLTWLTPGLPITKIAIDKLLDQHHDDRDDKDQDTDQPSTNPSTDSDDGEKNVEYDGPIDLDDVTERRKEILKLIHEYPNETYAELAERLGTSISGYIYPIEEFDWSNREEQLKQLFESGGPYQDFEIPLEQYQPEKESDKNEVESEARDNEDSADNKDSSLENEESRTEKEGDEIAMDDSNGMNGSDRNGGEGEVNDDRGDGNQEPGEPEGSGERISDEDSNGSGNTAVEDVREVSVGESKKPGFPDAVRDKVEVNSIKAEDSESEDRDRKFESAGTYSDVERYVEVANEFLRRN